MSTEENKAIVQRFWEEIERGKGLVGEDLFAPNYRHYFPGSPAPLDAQGSQNLGSMFWSAFPDLHATIEDQVAEGDRVVSRLNFHGTKQGYFQGIPPTGKQVTWTESQIFRLADGKIVEQWSNEDDIGRLQQVGALHTPG